MCTAISINDTAHLFGRTLDLECGLGEEVVISPRNFHIKYGITPNQKHHAIIGAAHVVGGLPLYYDGMNEMGLCAAALNFPAYAVYGETGVKKRGIPSYALITEVLGKCQTTAEAKELLYGAVITSEAFSEGLRPTPLHWIISDKETSIAVESVEEGLKIYDNPAGVLSNSPSFPYHMTRLCDYMMLTPSAPTNRLAPAFSLRPYSRGMGAIGLPGDFSSVSRFVRAVYSKMHTRPTSGSDISRFFHVIGTVNVPHGIVTTEAGTPASTLYTSCMDQDEKVYYFTTYEDRRIRAVKLFGADLDDDKITTYPMASREDTLALN